MAKSLKDKYNIQTTLFDKRDFEIKKQEDASQEKKIQTALKFIDETLLFFDEKNYKTITKSNVEKWESRLQQMNLVNTIKISSEKLPTGKTSTWILIELPWYNKRHMSIWLDNPKEKMNDLKESLKMHKEAGKLMLQKLKENI